ncbi:MAG: cellulose biosynthesis protein BcsN [Hyphomicrobiales bacterium]|nr:cellulose biosynthesis protein BcsN [Hyphomicrobiales bacterium]
MRKILALTLLTCATALGGCALSGMKGYQSAASRAFYQRDNAQTRRRSAASALAALPATAGRVLTVDETRYSNGISQKIILAGGLHGYGSNEIDIRVRLSADPTGTAPDPITLPAGDDVSIASELADMFPHIAMHDVPVLLQNRYGPYGLAAGKSTHGETCIYAWQSYDNFGHRNHAAPASLVSGFVAPLEPATIRVRLCQNGVSADALGGLMNELYLSGSGGSVQPTLVNPQIDRSPGISADALGPTDVAASGGFSGYRMPQKRVVLERAAPRHRRIMVRRQQHRAPPHVAITHVQNAPLQNAQMPYQLPARPAYAVPPPPAVAVPAATPVPVNPTVVAPAPPTQLPGLPAAATQGPQGAKAMQISLPQRALHPLPDPTGAGSQTSAASANTDLLRAHTLNGSGS